MRKTAFTLIELLVVVAIIAILFGILMPSLAQARSQAKAVTCSTRLYQIGVAIQCYMTDYNGHIPRVVSPMNNGTTAQPGFGTSTWTDEQLNPFDRTKWPLSLPNLLMPRYVGEEAGLFVCPAATLGWPRSAKPLRYTYREAAANQPNGKIPAHSPPRNPDPRTQEWSYDRESFGFMDGRLYSREPLRFVPNKPILNVQIEVANRRTFVRDLVKIESTSDGTLATGPHREGINVINNDFTVEFRDRKTMSADLVPNGDMGVRF